MRALPFMAGRSIPLVTVADALEWIAANNFSGVAGVTFRTDGSVLVNEETPYVSEDPWLLAGLASNVEVLGTKTAGTGTTSGTGIWKPLTADVSFSTSNGLTSSKYAIIRVDFRHAISKVMLGSNTLNLTSATS